MKLDILTDSALPEGPETDQHRVSFGEECLVTATNAGHGGRVGLDMEILSLAMERAKGTQVAVSFDSEQGGETADDFGYIPVLKKLVGGRLHFLISPDGKMMKADGIPEWLALALGETPVQPGPPKTVARNSPLSNAPPLNLSVATNGLTNILRKVGRNMFAPSGAFPPSNRRGPVSTALHGFFTPELFRQMLEFKFLPAAPVHVGEEWKSKGDTPINGRVQFQFQTVGKFAGWQQHSETNCARIDVQGTLFPQGAVAPAGTAAKKDLLKATLWIDQELAFPMSTILDTQAILSTQTTVRTQGTNNIVTNGVPRSVRQNVAINLLDTSSIEAPASESATPSQ